MSKKENQSNIPATEISVLIPVYNVEQYLSRCLDSVLNQTFSQFEIVCVNDAATDGSLEMLESYASKDTRIRIISKDTNEGLMMARRTGYQNARGRYLFFLDSDDYLPADAFATLHQAITLNKTDIAVGNLVTINNEGKSVNRHRALSVGTDWCTYLRSILLQGSPSLCGSLFSKRLFEDIEYETFMHQSFSEDRMLLTQLLLKKHPSVTAIDFTSYYYWYNTNSITRSKITRNKTREQLEALFRSYYYVSESGCKLYKENDEFIIRYLSFLLEWIPWRNEIRDFNDVSRDLLTYKRMRKIIPRHLVLHTLGLLHLPYYPKLATAMRHTVRKLQHKF